MRRAEIMTQHFLMSSGWDFKIRGYAGPRHPSLRLGTLLLETTHNGEASAYIEIEAWKTRMRGGYVTHVELVDLRPGGKLTNLMIYPETEIPWSWQN